MGQRNVVIGSIRVQALLNATDVARILRISRSMAYELFQRGEIDTVRMGSAVRCTEEALDAYIERHTVRATADWPLTG